MSDYYVLVTDAGAELEAAAHAAGESVELSEFGVCDGGVDFTPDPALTAFVNEVYRGAISALEVSADDPSEIVAQCIIPADSGGYTLRGVAIYASDGTLYAVGNYAAQDKPAPDSGFAVSLEILVVLALSATTDVTLVVTDTAYLTEKQADTLYLRQDKNLDEIAKTGDTAQQAARDNLGLGSAATASTGDFISITGGNATGALTATWLAVRNATTGKTLSLDVQDSAGNDVSMSVFSDGTHQKLDYADTQGWLISLWRNIADGSVSLQVNGTMNADVINEAGQRVYSPNNPQPIDLSPYATSDWVAGNFVTGTQLGTQGSLTMDGGLVEAPWGCVLTGGNGNEGHQVGFALYRPLQYIINGAPYTAPYASTLQMQTLPVASVNIFADLPHRDLTELANCQPYYNTDAGNVDGKPIICLRDENGVDWYQARFLLTGAVFIAYEPDTGIIRLIDSTPVNMWPWKLSVRGLDSLPDDCSIDGTWVWSDGTVSRDATLLANRARSILVREIRIITSEILMYEHSTPRPGDAEKAHDLREYLDILRDDLDEEYPVWPLSVHSAH
ncbi:phage tail protein [Serratia rhizosphaerae]|uniref:Phage tail fibre protein N-terminal domain-containing protein n=1 Tax=Serratia rhizosphaerae TaxID=2597702 RepID=A0ABX6GHF6_9GAMM|nr:phage tail protein [Serratia rhizosphaerae]QHA85685.1 hypothetical protein FO014_01090 [Serratia rhizosphaerae]